MKIFSVGLPQSIYLIRHGKTDYNSRFEDQGLVEIHGQLNKLGRKQVKTTSEELIKSVDTFTVNVITSPKRRCWQSANILIQGLESRNVRVNIEVNSGFRDVKTINQSPQRKKGSYGDWEKNLNKNETWIDGWLRCKKFYHGEESPDMLYKRVSKAIKSISYEHPTIIVCHEEVMLAFTKYFNFSTKRPDYAEA